jgi:hypothetical protein
LRALFDERYGQSDVALQLDTDGFLIRLLVRAEGGEDFVELSDRSAGFRLRVVRRRLGQLARPLGRDNERKPELPSLASDPLERFAAKPHGRDRRLFVNRTNVASHEGVGLFDDKDGRQEFSLLRLTASLMRLDELCRSIVLADTPVLEAALRLVQQGLRAEDALFLLCRMLAWIDRQSGHQQQREVIEEAVSALPLPQASPLLRGAFQILRDKRGFVVTGQDLLRNGHPPQGWPLGRLPLHMETSMPGVFAAGDVRYGSVKRVASAVGAGAIAIQSVHEHFLKARLGFDGSDAR